MTEDQPEDDYRFGFTEEQIVLKILTHKGMIRGGCYVPTRTEVATWPADRLWSILLGWWWESPASLTPTDEQVAQSIAVQLARPDAHSKAIQKIIA